MPKRTVYRLSTCKFTASSQVSLRQILVVLEIRTQDSVVGLGKRDSIVIKALLLAKCTLDFVQDADFGSDDIRRCSLT
jgi:hypothetical protein